MNARLVTPMVLGVSLLMFVAACDAAPKRTMAPAASSSIVMKNFDFHPMSLTIPAGATVTWKNLDGEPHTVTSVDGLFRSGALDENDTFKFAFAKPGTYKYLCSIHPRMLATIIVK
jgi:plastocyanin